MQITIATLSQKVASNGAPKWSLKTSEGKYFDSFANDWNKGWQVGQTIELTEDQITSRLWNGKTYYSIVAPKVIKSVSRPAGFSADVAGAISGINAKLETIIKQNNEILARLTGDPGVAPSDEIPF